MALKYQEVIQRSSPKGKPMSDMELGTKIKIANTKFVLIAKDHSGFPSGSLTVLSEGSVNNGRFGGSQLYKNSQLRTRAKNFINKMSDAEKKYLLITPIISNGETLNDQIFVPSEAEYGGSYSREGSPIGNIRNYTNLGIYHWTRSKYVYNDVSCYCFYPNGQLLYYGYDQSAGTQICMNFDNKAKLKDQDDEGYYLF